MRRLIACALLAAAVAVPAPRAAGPAQAQAGAARAAPADAPRATPAQAPPAAERRVRFSFTLQNRTGRLLEHEAFAAYAPVQETATQTLLGLEVSLPVVAEVDALGNQVLRFSIDALPPYASRVVSVEARLAMAEAPRPQALAGWLREAYTRPERYVESDDPRIAALARSLRGSDARQTARAVYDWVRQSLQRLQYTAEDLGARRALELRAGDCTEHAYLFVALARAAGLPARALGGFVMPESGVLDPSDYHNWAEFYADGAWRLADTHRGAFERQASHYVAMRLISSAVPSPLGSSHRYAGGGDTIRITMN